MKTKTFLSQCLWLGAFSIALFTSPTAVAQEQNSCSVCTCQSSVFTEDCMIRCCLPKVPDCNCGWFSNQCACSTGYSSSPPALHTDNVLALTGYLRSGVFTSPTASNLASNLVEVIKIHQTGDAEAYHNIASRIETIGRELPANEKQLINVWIRSAGSETTIP